ARHGRGGQRSLLRGVRRALARAFEADRSSRGPAHGAAVQVGDRDLRVVERRRSRSPTWTAAPCAGPRLERSASKARARALLTPRSRLRWPPRAWRAISMA